MKLKKQDRIYRSRADMLRNGYEQQCNDMEVN